MLQRLPKGGEGGGIRAYRPSKLNTLNYNCAKEDMMHEY